MRWLPHETVEHLRRLAEWPDLADTKYVVREQLGRGGMGTVYLAEDTVLGRLVALKVAGAGESDSETARRMVHEARVVARLEHPGIVPVHDVGTLPDGRVFYAMKRVDGRRLDQLAAEASLSERLRIFQRICEAVAFAHARGVIHRDLKPENIMVGPFGEVLVMDWGVAKFVDGEYASRPASSISPSMPLSPMSPPPMSPPAMPPPAMPPPPAATADGVIVGTPAYMAPEQAEGRRSDIGRATDVYALGAILYFLLTQRPPFDAEAAGRRARGRAAAGPPAPRHWDPSIPRPIEAIAVKAMSNLPADRYGSVEALTADTARFLDRQRVLAYRESPFERAGRFFERHRAAILLVLAYLVMRAMLILYGRR